LTELKEKIESIVKKPKEKYKIEKPKSNKLEAMEPIVKYFIPDSVEN
jgi:hypothetical protein